MKQIHFTLFVLVIAALTGIQAVFAQDASAIPQVSVEVSADSVTLPAEMPAGIVNITFTNNKEAASGPMFARLNEGVTQEAFMTALQDGPMAAIPLVALLGGSEIQPAASMDATFDFTPGNYVFLDFNGEMPIVQPFTVADAENAATAPEADVSVKLTDFAFTLPTTISAGEQTWFVENQGTQWHEMGIARIDENTTVHELHEMVTAFAAGGEEGPNTPEEMFFWAPMTQGERAWFTLDLEPGMYLVACFLPDFATGNVHANMGMMQTITVTE